MLENFNKLLESVTFRFKSIFIFKNLSFFACFCKIMLLIILGLPFCIIELFGILFALCSCIPIIGIVFNLTFCLICDLLASLLFYLIMLPNTNSTNTMIQNITQKKLVFRIKLTESEYQDVYDALSWCCEELDNDYESIVERYKDKLFLGTITGSDGLYLQKLFIKIKSVSKNSMLSLKLEKAINILEEHIYK